VSRLRAPNPPKQKTSKWRIILAAVLLFSLGGVGYFYQYEISQGYQQLVRHQSKFLGLSIQKIKVEGYRRTLEQDIQQALGIRVGDPMVWVELEQMYDRLKVLPWVKDVVVERRWPNRLYIRITEKEPLALWQNHYKVTLIDTDGNVIPAQNVYPFKKLPLIIGEGAPQAAKELLEALRKFPHIQKYLVAIIRISQRRWNLLLADKKMVYLPEVNQEEALGLLDGLHKSQGIFSKFEKFLDLRIKDKVVLR
jgi:cell division protein FtsQ